MGMRTETVCVGEGAFALEAVLTVTPRGIVVFACTPEFAHVGATAQAIPRPEPGRTATVSLLAVPCHRDEIPAHDIAAALATRFSVPCVASTGYHVDNATPADLQKMLDVNKQLITALEKRVGEMRESDSDE
jgi:isopentenyl-diphosphate delta-isomerase